MEFFKFKKDIAFMKHASLLNVLSIFVFIGSIIFISYKGLHFSIEFTGGTVIEVSYENEAPIEQIRSKLKQVGFDDFQVQRFGSSKDVLIKVPLDDEKKDSAEKIYDEIKNLNSGEEAQLRRIEYIGPQIGSELAFDGLLAIIFVIIGIMIYLAVRFEWKFSIAAIVANLHDVVIILGFFAAFQWEFSLSVLAAVLAVLGYSVNESVVAAAHKLMKTDPSYKDLECQFNEFTVVRSRSSFLQFGLQRMLSLQFFLHLFWQQSIFPRRNAARISIGPHLLVKDFFPKNLKK